MTSSIKAGASMWCPPSPYEYTLAREILTLYAKHVNYEEYGLVQDILEEGGICLEMMDRASVQELLYSVRGTICVWVEGEITERIGQKISLKTRETTDTTPRNG